ncbi:dynein axonemal assembly factor 3 homolog [Triticum urartu]|uniref:dynein axonemal assembly factor 3 homolog n=1 Tax=Triticum urartu TaxID=4572 RepID=UPI0020442160|nr:dynein axonemal assembly factor 3 homolog [Triticum urartu]
METDTPPAAAAPGVGAQTLALAVAAAAACSVAVEDKATAKRARKRSRYLADYETPTILNTLHGDDDDDCIVTPPPPPRKGAVNEGPALLLRLRQANVAAADLLAALHRCAASPYEPPGTGGVDAGLLLGFFALHREASASVPVAATHRAGKDAALVTTGQHRSTDAPAAARPNPCQAMAVSNGSAGKEEQAGGIAIGHAAHAQAHHHIGAGPPNAAAPPGGGAGPSKRRKKKEVTFALGAPTAAGCSAQPPTHGVGATAMACYPAYAQAHHAGPSNADAALGGTGPSKRKKKKVAFALGAPASAAGAGCSAQLAATHSSSTGSASSAPKKPAKNKKAVNGQQHFSKPVALILQFAPGTAADQLPSKEQLHSTLRGFGPLIEPSTEITKKQARVVFQSSAAAEAAYSCVHTLGDFAAARLQYLRPPPPPPKIPLTDVRKNLERMIASLTGPRLLGKEDSAWSLAGEMQHLLVKVDRALNAGRAGPSTSAAAHHY